MTWPLRFSIALMVFSIYFTLAIIELRNIVKVLKEIHTHLDEEIIKKG